MGLSVLAMHDARRGTSPGSGDISLIYFLTLVPTYLFTYNRAWRGCARCAAFGCLPFVQGVQLGQRWRISASSAPSASSVAATSAAPVVLQLLAGC